MHDYAIMARARQYDAAQYLPRPDYVNDPVRWIKDRLGETVWSGQVAVAESVRDNRYTAVRSGHDLGKLLRLDEPIPTPTGWTANGDLAVGDQVLDEQGRPCQVVAVSEVQAPRCYRLVFDDGTTIDAGEGHQWSVLDLRRRKVVTRLSVPDWREHWDSTAVMTTRQLFDAGLTTTATQRRWRIPLTRPLDLPEQPYTIAPYVLGAWLGDGTSTQAALTVHPDDIEIVKRVAETENVKRTDPARYRWALTGPHPLGRLHVRLRALGVLGDKHIPVTYLRGSIEQRMDLLRGLMDTDGHIEAKWGGTCELSLCNERLARDAADLIASLGWKVRIRVGPATLNGRVVGTRWRLGFRPMAVPFHLARKAARWQPPGAQAGAATQRTIVSITEIDPVPMRCITVDSPRRLFLAGRSYLPTHNSYVASRLGAWWLDAHPPGEAFLVTTAPSAAQVSAILWREITRAHGAAARQGRALRGRVTRAGYPQWHIDGELVGYGRKPADYEQSAFQGIHALYVLVIMDEAGGIPRALYDAVDALATNQHARVLAIGNPDDASNHFANVCRPDSGWTTMHLDCLRSPNMTAEAVAPYPALSALMAAEGIEPSRETVPDKMRPLLVSAQWVAERIHRWAGVTPELVETAALNGDDVGQMVRSRAAASPLFQVKVRGEFSDPGDHNVIPLGWAQQAMNRWRDLRWSFEDRAAFADSQPGRRVAGVDVAREGADETCVFLRQGRLGVGFTRYAKQDTMETVDRVREHVGNFTGAQAVVDAIGIGAGVVDRLRQLKREGSVICDVVAFTASEQSDRRDASGSFRFRNDRAAAWWHLRELLDPARGSDLMLPYDDQLLADLTTPQWKMYQGSILTVEPKEDIRKRLGRSPDVGDACVMAFWVAGAPLPLVERPAEIPSPFDITLEEWAADMPIGAESWLS